MTTLPKYDWYQNGLLVAIIILKPGTDIADCSTKYNKEDRRLVVKHKDDVVFDLVLYNDIDYTKTTTTCTKSKIEVKVQKLSLATWPSLTSSGSSQPPHIKAFEVKAEVYKPKGPKNWDLIEKEALEEEEKDNSEDINHLFKKIYSSSNDETKKAMLKSYTESNGTVLSTNWNEVKDKKVETKPPDDMEFVKYDQ
uniref:Suppressor of G2 allele of SKP1 n=1 Tax=Parastrongyloides trichosuri TaxID=131310 RepID=A0A0N4Z8V6_PARTI